jgi:hypothetical protein
LTAYNLRFYPYFFGFPLDPFVHHFFSSVSPTARFSFSARFLLHANTKNEFTNSPEGRCGWEPLYSIFLAMEHEFTNRPFQKHSWIGQKTTTFFFWLALVSGWNQDLGLVLLYLLNAGKLIGCKKTKKRQHP